MQEKQPDVLKELCVYFAELYRKRVKQDYEFTWGRDKKLFKDFLISTPRPQLEKLLKLYFETERNLYSLPFFKMEINTLKQILANQRKSKVMVNQDRSRFESKDS